MVDGNHCTKSALTYYGAVVTSSPSDNVGIGCWEEIELHVVINAGFVVTINRPEDSSNFQQFPSDPGLCRWPRSFAWIAATTSADLASHTYTDAVASSAINSSPWRRCATTVETGRRCIQPREKNSLQVATNPQGCHIVQPIISRPRHLSQAFFFPFFRQLACKRAVKLVSSRGGCRWQNVAKGCSRVATGKAP